MRVVQTFWRRHLLKPVLALLALNAVVFAVYTLPRTLREKTLAARAQALKADLDRERRSAQALERRANTLESNTQDALRFYRKIVGSRSARLVPVLREIERAARSQGLAAGRGAYRPDVIKNTPLVRFVITMPLSGTYVQLVSFLGELERSTQFLIVDQVLLRERQGAGVDLDVVVSTYFREEGGSGRGR